MVTAHRMEATKDKPKLIVIAGPTASGKTSMSIELAKEFHGEIISADSRKIYKGMNIGSAKPTDEQQQGIPHYGFDLVAPHQAYNVKEFQSYAFRIIKDIHAKGKIPFLVGGTGLYISSVIDNYQFVEYKPNVELRKRLDKKDLSVLIEELKQKDAHALSKDDWRNKQRVVKALEFCLSTGKKFSKQSKKGEPLFDVLLLGIKLKQELLDEKIKRRIDYMVEKEGLMEEVKQLMTQYGWDAPGMKAIAYQEWKCFFEHTCSLEDVKEKMFYANRQYAKRQITWFKRDKRMQWISTGQEAKKLIQTFI